jgi:omega-6 fatty acid desaturase (delta-12 desaturase)
MGYVVVDLAIVVAAGCGVELVASLDLHPAAAWAAWAAYWWVAGNILTGVWVIAHECGHQSFSESKLANNIMGTILHSALLVPYHPWRISHSQHHKFCCSIEDDMAFVPTTRSRLSESLGESPLAILVYGLWMMVAGW